MLGSEGCFHSWAMKRQGSSREVSACPLQGDECADHNDAGCLLGVSMVMGLCCLAYIITLSADDVIPPAGWRSLVSGRHRGDDRSTGVNATTAMPAVIHATLPTGIDATAAGCNRRRCRMRNPLPVRSKDTCLRFRWTYERKRRHRSTPCHARPSLHHVPAIVLLSFIDLSAIQDTSKGRRHHGGTTGGSESFHWIVMCVPAPRRSCTPECV